MNRTETSVPSRSERPSLVLAGFVLLVFCTASAEYLVAGVLPQLASDVSVSIAAAGQTVTAYALGVAIGGPIVTVLTARLPRKGLAIGLGVLFVAGTVLTVLAPSFAWIIVGRVVSACSQATLFAISLTTATALMGPDRQGRAIAIVTSGLTVATVLGVPLGALLGGGTNWRLPFAVIAAAAVLGTVLLALTMPRTPAPTTGVGDEIRTLLRGPVLLAVATTVIGFAGVSVVFTYLVPLLTDVTGILASVIPALLLAYGAGGFVGNLIAGRLVDLSLGKTLVGVFLALILTLAAFPLVAPHPAPMIGLVLVLGLLSTATIAPLQSLVLRHAGAAPTLSLAVNVGAYNLAIAIGSALGGLGVAAGLIQWGGLGGAAFAILGLILTALALRATPRTNPTAPVDNETKEKSL
ncbi:MFS transporter [Brachybacterium tyrofermentans]|uniref:MFS transporter n=1 Tax=Brachybacterium tyrofermentans TaxID=47848 RepID=UPI003FD3D2D1